MYRFITEWRRRHQQKQQQDWGEQEEPEDGEGRKEEGNSFFDGKMIEKPISKAIPVAFLFSPSHQIWCSFIYRNLISCLWWLSYFYAMTLNDQFLTL